MPDMPKNPLIEPGSLMDTALHIASALQTVGDFLQENASTISDEAGIRAVWGHILLVEAAKEAAGYVNEVLDVQDIAKARKAERAGDSQPIQ